MTSNAGNTRRILFGSTDPQESLQVEFRIILEINRISAITAPMADQ